jgi:prolyl oligopeptidase
MRRLAPFLLLLTALASPAASAEKPAYPASRVDDVVENIHGTEVHDPYRWLEDGSSSEVQAWAKNQNAFARNRLDGLAGRDWLSKRLREVSYVDAAGVPQRAGPRLFFTRRTADQEKAVLYWRGDDDGVEHVLVDPNALSADGTTSLGEWVPSYDGRTLAYALQENNADEATLYVKDVATGKVSERDRIEGAKYAVPSWTPAGDGFYYTWLPTDPSIPEAERPGRAEIRYHTLGTEPAKDTVVRPATNDPEKFLWPELSRDGHWLLASLVSFSSADISYKDLRTPGGEWKKLIRSEEFEYWPLVWQDRFYLRTNDGGTRFRVLRVDPSSPDRKNWVEIVPEAPDAVLQGTSVVGGRLALSYLRNAASEIELRTLDGKKVRSVKLPGIGSSSGLVGTPDRDEAFYDFSSLTHTPEIWRTSVATGRSRRWAKREVPVDPEPYTVEQVFLPSKDGTKIPMFVVHRSDAPKGGSMPFLLYGYGGFGISLEPSFSARLYPWLEAGGGFALANLRGGGEYGEDWHKAGALGNKQNTFDDFIAAGEYLVQEGWTKPERLAIQGGSNGGLLVGAVLTQRPDLFKAVICEVPLLDMVRYHRFGSGRTWVSEYGSADKKDDFAWLYAYSPYHHVKADTGYPAVLMSAADSDDRVDPLHARKMTAALQAASTGGPVLLRVEENAGHGGADLVSSAVAKAVDYYAFLFDQLGMRPPAS